MTTMTERRDASSRDSLVADIACAIRSELAGLTVPEDIHREHHEFIREWIEERKIKRARSEKIRTQVSGWALVSALSAIGTCATTDSSTRLTRVGRILVK